jgi:hypothetical protein
MDHILVDAVSLENELMTKAQRKPWATDRFDMPGNQATGQVIHSRTSVSYPNVIDMGANLVSSPVFEIETGEVAPPPPTPTPGGGGGGGGWGSCPGGCAQSSCNNCACIDPDFWRCCVHNNTGSRMSDFWIEYKSGNQNLGLNNGFNLEPGDTACANSGDPGAGWYCHFGSNCGGCASRCGGRID